MRNNKKIPIDLFDYALKFLHAYFPKEIEKFESIQGLKKNLCDKKDKENKEVDDTFLLKTMNSLLDFLKLHSVNRDFENLKIFPNQNGNFCTLNSLYSDGGFPEEFKFKKIF